MEVLSLLESIIRFLNIRNEKYWDIQKLYVIFNIIKANANKYFSHSILGPPKLFFHFLAKIKLKFSLAQ